MVNRAGARCLVCEAIVGLEPTPDPRVCTWSCARCGAAGLVAWSTAAPAPVAHFNRKDRDGQRSLF